MKRAVVISLVAAGLAAGFAWTRGTDEVAAPASATPRAGYAPRLGPGLRARGLSPGTEHHYAVALDHQSTPSEGAGFALAVEGEWVVGVIPTPNATTTTVRAELREPRVRLGAVTSAMPKLAAPYTFTLGDDGRLLGMQFPRGLDHDARVLLTALAATAQLTDGTAATWTATETDALGAYEARYRRDGEQLAKAKLAYRSAAGDRPLAITVVESAATIALRADGWPEAIEQRERLRVGLDKAIVTVSGHTTLRHVGARAGVASAVADLEAVPVDATSVAARDQDDRELLDGAALVDLIAVMGSVRDDGNASAHTYLRMVALFRLDPDAARSAGEQLLGGTLDPRDASAVIGALGEAGTPLAQQVLSRVVDTSSVAAEQRVAGALSLGLTTAPLPATLATLTTASQASDPTLAATATLALGNAALHLSDTDAAAAARQTDELLARLARTSTIPERVILLRALGNTGDPRILPALEASLGSASDVERAAATESLRLVPDGRADALVIAMLEDGSSVVRSAAVFAASHRRLDPVAYALAVRARIDQDAVIRRAIVELAGQRMNELPSLLRPIVVHAAAQDRDAEIRDVANKFLS